ncbi:MAG: hypothetical protein JJU11_11095, partial [Candidatus Sumerlaeia bacterium]|nr:hypothetical protein [Candidatus Sumerlaeia bacterium]
LLGEDKIPVVKGRSLTTATAVRAALAPYRDTSTVFFMDTARLDDPFLLQWIEHCNHLMLTIRMDKQSIKALPGVNSVLAELRKANPGMRFMGFLPTLVDNDRAGLVRILDQAVPGYTIPISIPRDNDEHLRSQVSAFKGLDHALNPNAPAQKAYVKLSGWMAERLDLEPIREAAAREEDKKETGVISRLWKLAASRLSPRVQVTGGSSNG